MKKRAFLFLMLAVLAAGLIAKVILNNSQNKGIQRLSCLNINQSCGNEVFTARFSEAVRVMKPLALFLHVNQGEAVRSVYVSFAMKGMEMGLNRYRLLPAADGWTAEVTLPACVQGRNDWEMLVEIELGSGTKRFLLPFSAVKN